MGLNIRLKTSNRNIKASVSLYSHKHTHTHTLQHDYCGHPVQGYSFLNSLRSNNLIFEAWVRETGETRGDVQNVRVMT